VFCIDFTLLPVASERGVRKVWAGGGRERSPPRGGRDTGKTKQVDPIASSDSYILTIESVLGVAMSDASLLTCCGQQIITHCVLMHGLGRYGCRPVSNRGLMCALSFVLEL
jgi:hypothetical protein